MTRSCSVRCEYCPQDQLVIAGAMLGQSHLSFEMFAKCVDNISGDIKRIHWTGYAEPCLSKDFPKMVLHAKSKGFDQMVSTTLVGHEHCIDFLATTDAVATIVLHLPDANSLMERGSLKVDNNYVERLRKFLEGRLQHLNTSICDITSVTFGESYHPKIASVLADRRYQPVLLSSTVSSKIHSRAGAVRNFSGFSIGMISRKALVGRQKAILYITVVLKSISLPLHRCSYLKFRQPVLLPDGQLNLCCMDYGLRGILGNLSKIPLNTIYSNWSEQNMDAFVKGKLSPCLECEYYQHVSLYDFLRYLRHQKWRH